MAAKHVALKLECGRQQGKKIEAEKASKEIIDKANLTAEKRSQEVMAQALTTQQRAIDQAQELTKDSGSRAERMQIESNRKLAEIDLKIEAKEKELALKKALTAEFEKNPEVVTEWQKKKETDKYTSVQIEHFVCDGYTDGKFFSTSPPMRLELNAWLSQNNKKVEITEMLKSSTRAEASLAVIYRWLVQLPETPKEIANEKAPAKTGNPFVDNASNAFVGASPIL